MKKTIYFIILSILFIHLIGFTLAQEVVQVVPNPNRAGPSAEEIQELAAESAQKISLFNTALWVIVGLSLVLGFFITKRMIKTNPKITNWIIHAIIALVSFIVFLLTSIDGMRCLMSPYCGFPSVYYSILIATFLSAMLSIFTIIGFAKKRADNEYRANMSSSTIFIWIIFILLAAIAELIIKPDFDIPAFFILPIFSGVIILALYFVLGIIGYFIDRSNNL